MLPGWDEEMKRFVQHICFRMLLLAVFLSFGIALASPDDQQKRPPKEKVELKKVEKKIKDNFVPKDPKAGKSDRENEKNQNKEKDRENDKGGDKKKGKGN